MKRRQSLRLLGLWTACCIWLAPSGAAAELKPQTVAAFDRYIQQVEGRERQREQASAGFLWVDGAPERLRRVRAGEPVTAPSGGEAMLEVPGGLIHDWVGAIFVPGVTLDQALALVQQYDRHKEWYKPEVIDSRLLERNGDHFRIYLRLLKKKVLTVVLDTEHDVQYRRLGPHRSASSSRSTRIAEVENAGKADERVLPPGTGHGFLWRLNSYWRFEERDGGVYIECEAVSLTRDIPTGTGWLVGPIVRSLPKESLAHTLEATRTALGR